MNYDENDGYFDHVPPFVPPHTGRPETGLASAGIDTRVEYVTMEQEKQRGYPENSLRESPIGLGYRVPMVVASPWSRGGWVNSQVFDHTSCLQFLETFLGKKTGRKVAEPNISDWRRVVCGDLTSVFRTYNNEKITVPDFIQKVTFIQSVHQARFKKLPSDFKSLTKEEVEANNLNPALSAFMPQQEQGIRSSCAIPYQLHVNGKLSPDKKLFTIDFETRKDVFGDLTAGAPFMVYAPGTYKRANAVEEQMANWSFAVKAGDRLVNTWPVDAFGSNNYHLRVYGPNGFFREFIGNAQDPAVEISCDYERSRINKKRLAGNIELKIVNTSKTPFTLNITDHAYKANNHTLVVQASGSGREVQSVRLNLKQSFGWYDFSIKINGNNTFEKRFAGRVETGKPSYSDPFMGRAVV
nr:phospholipase domain-containing protein [Pontibacter sp. SGAir0037]